MAQKTIVGASTSMGIDWNDVIKKLLVVEPLEVEKDIKTQHGLSDAVRANVYVVLSADGSKYESFEDILIFPRKLQGQTRRKIGQLVVGRLTQGEAQKGKNPPWELAEPSDKDMKAAQAFLAVLNTSPASSSSDDGEEFDEGAPWGDDGGASDDGDESF